MITEHIVVIEDIRMLLKRGYPIEQTFARAYKAQWDKCTITRSIEFERTPIHSLLIGGIAEMVANSCISA
jgi:hypothetical protein